MTPKQLLQLRKARQLTREQLGKELGCAAGSIVNWERGLRSIPNWVEEKMLSNVSISLPITELHQLLDSARASGKDFTEILAQAIREYIAPKAAPIPFPAPGAKQDTSALRVAEDPSGYTTAPATASGGSQAATPRTVVEQAAADFLAQEAAAARASAAPPQPDSHRRAGAQPRAKRPEKHQ